MAVDVKIRFLADIAAAKKGFDDIVNSGNTMAGRLRGLGGSLSGIGQSLMTGVTLPIIAGFAGAAKVAIDYEKQLSGTARAIGLNKAETAGLKNDIAGLSVQFGMLPTKFASIADEVAKAGVEGKKNILSVSQTVAKASVLLDLPAQATAESFGKVASVYNLQGKAIDAFAASINYLGDTVGGKESEILKTVAAAGSTALASKMTVQQITAMAATYGRLGVEAGVAANAIKTQANSIFEASSGKSKKHNAVLKQLGLTYKDLQGIIDKRGMAAAIEETNKRFAKLQGASQALSIAEFYGNNYNDTIGVAIGRTDILSDAFKKAENSQAALSKANKEWAAAQDTTAFKLGVVQSKLFSLADTVGSALLPAIADVLNAITPTLNAFGKFAQANPGIVRLGVAIVGVVAVVAPLLVGLGSLISALGSIWGFLSVVVPAFVAWAGGVPILASAIGVVTGVLAVLWGGLGAIVTAIGAIVTAIAAFVGAPVALVVAAIAGIAAGAFLIWKNWDWVTKQLGNAVNYMGQIFSRIPQGLQTAISWIPKVVASAIFGLPGMLFSAGVGMIDAFTRGIAAKANEPISYVQQIVQRIRDFLPGSDAKMGPLSTLTDAGRAFGSTFSSGMSANPVVSAVSNIASSASNALPVAAAASGGGGTTISINFSPEIYGGNSSGSSGTIIDQLRPLAYELVSLIEEAQARKNRGRL